MLKEEKEIFEGILNGNEQILKRIYKEYLPQVKRLINKNSGNDEDAEDIFQEALILIHKKLRKNDLNIDCSIGTYIYSVSRNMWLTSLKKLQRTVITDDLKTYDYELDENTIGQIINNEKSSLFRKYFMKLGDRCQDILTRFFNGESMKLIAEAFGYTEQYARKKKFDCKQTLISSMKKDPAFAELVNQL
ncbi:MAG: sigma-70 family RNA polymerase sigma factor [Bacteroidota bacterium]